MSTNTFPYDNKIAVPTPARLPSLPEEMQLRIVLELEPADILRYGLVGGHLSYCTYDDNNAFSGVSAGS